MQFSRDTYLASVRSDVIALYNDMVLAPPASIQRGAVELIVHDLMRPTGFAGLMVRIFRRFGGEAGVRSFIMALHERLPDAPARLWRDTCQHVLKGTDCEDANSVGGWSQREINLFLQLMRG